MLKVGLIGCGNISGAYLNNATLFAKQIKFVACADLNEEAALKCGEKYGIAVMNVDELLADKEIDIILNLTTPQAHAEINLKALKANKHVYCEKPFALTCESGLEVIKLAKEKNLRTGCAPDTFLGGAHQTCRKLIDDNLIGKVIAGTAFMMCHGHESWHPSPAFYYLNGGGPLFDMGPYYLTALINILGPVKKVNAMSTRSTNERQGLKVNENKTFPVEIDTHISATLEFEQGAIITLITTFDVWKHSSYCDIELHGTTGSIHEADPNCFSGDIRFFKSGLSADWSKIDNQFTYNDNSRGIGLADMAAAIEENRPHRASGELAYHVLDVMESIVNSAKSGKTLSINSSCNRPQALAIGLKAGQL